MEREGRFEFDRAYLDRLAAGDPDTERHFTRYFGDLLSIHPFRNCAAGEGLVGFPWAFLRAGAQRVIAGLWDVDDRSTADLMGDVYTDIAQGRSPSAALRAAKLAMIGRGGAAAKPYYWAPFQVFIGSRVIP